MTTAGIWEALIVSLAAAAAAYWRQFLTLPAAISAAILGTLILLTGGWALASATAGMFVITSLLSKRQARVDPGESGAADERRNLKQIMANGILLVVIAALHRFAEGDSALTAAFLGCAGAVAGDTWATAAAQFTHAPPRLLTSGKRVAAGTPGAVTGIGILLTALAGLAASILYLAVRTILDGDVESVATGVALTLAAVVGAVAGSLFDSYLGAARQAVYKDASGQLTDDAAAGDGRANTYIRGWRWLSNDLVNFSNSVAGALFALCVWFSACWLNLV